jgi:hypothetical protein
MTVGTTWYDYQHNGTAGQMIAVDEAGWVHMVWMNGLESGAIHRHIYYNVFMGSLGWLQPGVGVAVESQSRAGYACLAMYPGSYAIPAFHVITPTSPESQPHSAVSADYIPGAGAFFQPPWELPYVVPPGEVTCQLIWPKIAVDHQGRVHLISVESPQSGTAGDPQRVYYCRGTFDPAIPSMTFIPQVYIEWTEVIACDIAAAYSTTHTGTDRVALTYHKIRQSYTGDSTQYDNDVFLYISEDGTTWDFNHPTYNITDFIPPDPGLLPDTTAANRDTLRAYCDASVIFDYANNPHVAYTVVWLDEIRGLIGIGSTNNSQIYHWAVNDGNQYSSLVADGWFDIYGEWIWVAACGAWQRYVHRPCMAIDTLSGYLYLTYQQYDTIAAADAYPQGDVMVSRSTDSGVRWSEGIHATLTGADSAAAGQCMSERDITCARFVVDDTLHMLYILDKDAGSVIQTPQEGSWTQNPVIYHKFPISAIPPTQRLMPRYPLHVDSTQFPPVAGPLPEHYVGVEIVQGPRVPASFYLEQNYPNPFNPTTKIRFDLSGTDRVTLKVYNIIGQEVATLVDGRLQAGTYEVPFDADNLASGVYFYKLSSSVQSETRKMMLLK